MNQVLQQKKGLVKKVFNKVFKKYDLMNDLMSLGIHRIWTKNLIQMMNPSNKKKLIDVACGTGDIAKLYLEATDKNSNILFEEGSLQINYKEEIFMTGTVSEIKKIDLDI